MKAGTLETPKQAFPPEKATEKSMVDRRPKSGRELNIHKASFIERRLFYLTRCCDVNLASMFFFDCIFPVAYSGIYSVRNNIKLCYKGMV